MLLQVFQHHVAAASAALLGPGATVVHVVLQLVERELQVTVLAGDRPQRAGRGLGEDSQAGQQQSHHAGMQASEDTL